MSIKELLTAKEQKNLSVLSDALNGNAPVVIFGAGNLGKKVVGALIGKQKNIVSFVDNNNTSWGKEVLGIKVASPKEAGEKWKDEAIWIVSIWSPGHSFIQTKKQLHELGVNNIYHAAAILQLFPGELLPHYHFQTPDYFFRHSDEITEVYNHLADDESKKQYLAQMDFRININFAGLPVADTQNQYFPTGIVSLTKEEVFLDAGAFDGDTLEVFNQRTRGEFLKYLALEPDPQNFQKLLSTVSKYEDGKVEAFPFAVGNDNCTLSFNATGGEGAGISNTGSVHVECKRIDDHFYKYRPTYLKFDIEGAELSALQGGRNTIESFHPKIAVCLYHLPDDMWTIPLLIKKYNNNYKLFVRTHSLDGFEFVLYAIPEIK
jgi:FkbM family methyltransferase